MSAPVGGCENVFAERDALERHESGGARATMHGFNFQFTSIMLWILRALKSLVRFKVSTEDDQRLGKFDDCNFTRLDVNAAVVSHTFVQIKHAQSDDGKIKCSDFFPENKKNGNFDLRILFRSYVNKIKKQFDVINIDTKLVVFTNRDFEYGSQFGGLVLQESNFESETEAELLKSDLLRFKSDFEGKRELIKRIINNDAKFIEADVNEFLSKFYFALNAQNISDIKTEIKTELELYFDKAHVDQSYYQYYCNFQDWYESNKGTIIDSQSIDDYFLLMRDKLAQKRHFNVLSANKNFHGRALELEEIEKLVVTSERSQELDVVVSGTAGVGKSELVRKCAEQLGDKFQHVVWLNAESSETLQSSYMQLAKYLQIPCKKLQQDEQEKFDETVVRKVNDFLRHRKCLLIFDNAESFLLKDLPLYLGTVNENHRTILTSQIRDWPCARELQLDVFSELDAQNFLASNLPGDSSDRDILAEVARLLSYLPLALQLCVAYVNQMSKRRKLLAKNSDYSLHDFYLEYKKFGDKFLNLQFSDARKFDNYEKSLYLAWQLALDGIRAEVNGDKAVQMLQIMAFLEADNISIELFNKVCGENEDVLQDAIYLLHSYSLIKCDSGQCSIHRLVQDVIRAKLDYDSNPADAQDSVYHSVLKSALDCVCICGLTNTFINRNHLFRLWDFIKNIQSLKDHLFYLDKNYDSLFHFVSVYLYNFKTLEILESKFLDLKDEIKKVLTLTEIYNILNVMFRCVCSCKKFKDIVPIFDKYFKFNHFQLKSYLFLDKHQIILVAYSYCCFQVKDYDKSIYLFDKMIQYLKSIQDESLMKFKFLFQVYYNKAKALIQQDKYVDALEVLFILLKESAESKFRYNQAIEFVDIEENMSGIAMYSDPWCCDETRTLVVNLTYICHGAQSCHETLQKFLNISAKIDVTTLNWIACLYRIEGKLSNELKIWELILEKLFSMPLYVPRKISMQYDLSLHEISGLLSKISKIDASFKRGCLKRICANVKTYLNNLSRTNIALFDSSEQIEFSNIQFSFADLLSKNGDYEESIMFLQKLNADFYDKINSRDPIINAKYYYQKSVCDIAMNYYKVGNLKKALETLDKAIVDETIFTTLDEKFNLTFTKSDILLMSNADETEAVTFLKTVISETESETIIFFIYKKIYKIYATRRKWTLALDILDMMYGQCQNDTHKCNLKVIYYDLKLDIIENMENNCDNETYFQIFEQSIEYNLKFNMHQDFYKSGEICDPIKIEETLINERLQTDDIANKGIRVVNNHPFILNSNVNHYLKIVFLYYKLQKYNEALLELEKIKCNNLNFISQMSVEEKRDILRLEKLIKFRKVNAYAE